MISNVPPLSESSGDARRNFVSSFHSLLRATLRRTPAILGRRSLAEQGCINCDGGQEDRRAKESGLIRTRSAVHLYMDGLECPRHEAAASGGPKAGGTLLPYLTSAYKDIARNATKQRGPEIQTRALVHE